MVIPFFSEKNVHHLLCELLFKIVQQVLIFVGTCKWSRRQWFRVCLCGIVGDHVGSLVASWFSSRVQQTAATRFRDALTHAPARPAGGGGTLRRLRATQLQRSNHGILDNLSFSRPHPASQKRRPAQPTCRRPARLTISVHWMPL